MKYCLEFGVRGGHKSDPVFFSSKHLAAEMAAALVSVLTYAEALNKDEWKPDQVKDWLVDSTHPRIGYTSCNFFIDLYKIKKNKFIGPNILKG